MATSVQVVPRPPLPIQRKQGYRRAHKVMQPKDKLRNWVRLEKRFPNQPSTPERIGADPNGNPSRAGDQRTERNWVRLARRFPSEKAEWESSHHRRKQKTNDGIGFVSQDALPARNPSGNPRPARQQRTKLGSSRTALSQRESRTGIESALENQRTKNGIGFVSHGASPTRKPSGNPRRARQQGRNWVRLAERSPSEKSERESTPRQTTKDEIGFVSQSALPARNPNGNPRRARQQRTRLGSSRTARPQREIRAGIEPVPGNKGRDWVRLARRFPKQKPDRESSHPRRNQTTKDGIGFVSQALSGAISRTGILPATA
jgi:hypothetical protein